MSVLILVIGAIGFIVGGFGFGVAWKARR